ncbi:hypothetical protein LY78DRAFT_58838 [Colletotrichum sublineola]|nr:hypothetical protein LY78DRAFT_58838 [Colletotrichum sublineola]
MAFGDFVEQETNGRQNRNGIMIFRQLARFRDKQHIVQKPTACHQSQCASTMNQRRYRAVLPMNKWLVEMDFDRSRDCLLYTRLLTSL